MLTAHAMYTCTQRLPEPPLALTASEIRDFTHTHTLDLYDFDDRGNRVTYLRGDEITPEDVETILADVHSQDVERAREFLSALEYGDCFGYLDATGCAYVVNDEDMAQLGRALHEYPGGAYDRWAAETEATRVDPHDLADGLSSARDVALLRLAADEDCDHATVVAVDLLRDQLLALVAANEDPNADVPHERVTDTRAWVN